MHGNDYLVLAGSTRPIRRSPTIAAWVAGLGNEAGEAAFRVIDLRDLGLELDDEPHIPAAGAAYESEVNAAMERPRGRRTRRRDRRAAV